MSWWRRDYLFRVSPRGMVRTCLILCLVALAAAGSAYAFRRQLLTAIGRQLIVEDALAPAGAIVALSGGSPERELEAADLYKAGIAPTVVLPHDPERAGLAVARSRGIVIESEQEFRRRLFTDLGVPSSAIVTLELEVSSTIDEASAVVEWALSHNVHRIVIVTSPFHTGRAALTYRRVVGRRDLDVRIHAARAASYRADSWWRHRVDVRDALIEWQKQVFYRLWY